jgi:hypothetical protein
MPKQTLRMWEYQMLCWEVTAYQQQVQNILNFIYIIEMYLIA